MEQVSQFRKKSCRPRCDSFEQEDNSGYKEACRYSVGPCAKLRLDPGGGIKIYILVFSVKKIMLIFEHF